MDVAASIVGLLAAAYQVHSALSAFLSTCHDAPIIAQTTSDEVRDFHYALVRLRDTVWQGNNITPLGRATTDTTQLILILASSMTTLAQVEKILDPLLSQPKMDYIRRIRWGFADGDLTKLLTRIQSHKLTLTLLLTIWMSESIAQAEASNDLLNDTLRGLLDPRYRGPLQPFNPTFYDPPTNVVVHGNAPGLISRTSAPVIPQASNTTGADTMSLLTVNKAFSIMSGKSLRSKLLNSRPYAGPKAFDSSAESVVSSQRATPWSEFTIGSNAAVFSLPFDGLDLDTKKISEVKDIHRISLPVDKMTFYNDWRYPERNISSKFPTGSLCILLSLFGLKAKSPRTGTSESGESQTTSQYNNISPSLARKMSRELGRHVREGGTHPSFLKQNLLSGVIQKDLQSTELLLFWSAQKRFGPSIGDEIRAAFRTAVRMGNRRIVELFLEWGAQIEVLDKEPDYQIFDLALELQSLEIIELFLSYGFETEKGYRTPAYTPLQAAVVGRYGSTSVPIATCLLELGVDVEGYCKEEPCTPLGLAMNSGNYNMVMILLARGADAEKGCCSNPSCTPLQAAAVGRWRDSLGLARLLLDHGVNIDGCCTEESKTPVELAMKNGNYKVLALLIDRGANFLKVGYDKPFYRPLQIAAMGRFDECLGFASFLLDQGANIEQGHTDETEPRAPLELAIEAGNLEMITLLLARGANPERASYGQPSCTPLQGAAMGKYQDSLGLTRLLLDQGANIDGCCTEESQTPVELAMKTGNHEVLAFLIDRGANFLKVGYDKPLYRPLQIAAMGRFDQCLGFASFLLDRGANIEQGHTDETEPRAPLELAIEAGNLKMITLLLTRGANPERASYGQPSCTPLQGAAIGKYRDSLGLTRLLLDQGVNIDGCCTEESQTPVELAMKNGNHEVLAFLIDRGANLLKVGYDRPLYRPLQIAAMGRFDQCLGFASFLLDEGANVEGYCEEEGRGPLELAIEGRRLEMVTLLLTRGANPEWVYGKPSRTPLQRAVMGENDDGFSLAKCLLEGGANVDGNCEEEGRRPLELAVEGRKLEMIALLLTRGANPERASYGQPSCTPLQRAAMEKSDDAVGLARCLLENGASVEGYCWNERRKPLDLAVESLNYGVIALLLARGANPESASYGEPSCTPLQRAAMEKSDNAVCLATCLLENGADVEGYCLSEQRKPLELAIETLNYRLITLLLTRGANPEWVYGKPPRTPLQRAVMGESDDGFSLAKCLLEGGANVDGNCEEEGRRPLELAVEGRKLDMITLLLARGANPERASYGQPSCTPLQRAVTGEIGGCFGLAKCLLEGGADVEGYCEQESKKPLELAMEMEGSNYEMIALLLTRGANPNSASYGKPPRTPLQKAAMGLFNDSVGLAKCLLEGGANVDSYCEEENKRPLELAVERSNYEMIEVLSKGGADPNRGYLYTPLQRVAAGNFPDSTRVMGLLLAGKPNVDGCAKEESRTPLQIAIDNRHHEMVSLLLSCEVDINKPYADSKITPIGKVIGYADLAMFKSLLCAGSDMERGYGSPRRTALQMVIEMRPINHLDMAEWLLDSGAKVDGHTDQEPRTPLTIAIQTYNTSMARFLMARGANLGGWYGGVLNRTIVDRV